MVLICSKITYCEVLFILTLGLFTGHVSLQSTRFLIREFGTSTNLTCPDPGPIKNHTYKFFSRSPITPGGKFKQYGNILEISNLNFHDSSQYSCSIYDLNGNSIKEKIFITILSVKPETKYSFKILPEMTSSVDEGASFEFRCEYGKGSTEIKWVRRRNINGTVINDYVQRKLITVLTDIKKSVEVYSIKKVSLNDSGTYKCDVLEKGKLRSTIPRVLQVERNRAPVFRYTKTFFTVKKGADLRILLDVTGAPFPGISCYYGDRLIISCSGETIQNTDISIHSSAFEPACRMGKYVITGLHELIITFASFAENDGMYKCEANNSVATVGVSFRVNVTVAPVISTESTQFFAQQKSKEKMIKCVIKLSNPRPTVIWSQQDSPKVSSSEAEPDADKWTVSGYESRLVQRQRGVYESILTIPWNKEESSYYRCFAENKDGNDSRVLKFIRYGEGKEPIVVTPKSAVKNEREIFVAECRVIIVFDGDIVFYKDNGTVMTNDNRTNITVKQDKDFRNVTMVIRNLTVNDSGTYKCGRRNVLTNDDATAVTLTVKGLRVPVILEFNNATVNKDVNRESTLFCNVTGNPYPKVKWFVSGIPPEPDLERSNCDGQEKGYYYKNKERTKLLICDLDISDAKFYTCSVENLLGSENRSVYLNVIGKPEIIKPTELEKKVLNAGESYEYVCEAKGNPSPWVQWIVSENKNMTNKTKRKSILKIISMDESHVGNYTCKVWNSFGSIEKYSLELKVNPAGKIPAPVAGSMPAGTIVAIVVGISTLLLVVFTLIFLWSKKQQKKLLFYKHQYFLKTGEYSVDPSLTLNEQSMNLKYDTDWEFPFERLVLGDRLGAGAFGEVYKAEAMGILALNPRDKSSIGSKRRSKIRRSLRASQRPKKKQIPADLSNATVAVKTVKAQATESEIRDLAAELKLMIHIGQHKNIVNLLGACTTGRKLYVILEFCPHGNMLTFLRSKRDIYESTWVKEIFNPEKEFTLIDIVGAAYQIAKGMEYLASQKLIHRDLAARNILIADEYVMKISDFGLARDIYQSDVYVKTTSGMLPVKWMAVESLFDRVYTHQSDVWSFGVLLWEMMTLGGTPYPNLPAEQLLDFLNNGKRMPQPNKCPLEVYTIMRDCWNEEPESRPTFSGLVEHLGRILEKHMEKANPYLHVEASPEEIVASQEKEELIKPKSDYYLLPLLMSHGQNRYDSNAPLPTPPTDTYVQDNAPLPKVDTKPSENPKMREARSYELLRDDCENGMGLKDMNNSNSKTNDSGKVESVV